MNRKILLSQVRDNIQTHWSILLSGFITTTFALSILGVFVLVYLNLIQVTEDFFHQSHYSIFLKQGHTAGERKEVIQAVQTLPGVNSVAEVSPKQAKKDLIASFEEAKAVLEKVNLEHLPWVIEFSLTHRSRLSRLEEKGIRLHSAVDEVFYGRETQDQVETFFQIANFVGSGLVLLLVVAILFIIKNTILLAIRSREKEIAILSYLGATPRFIQLPFVIEGALIGGCAALASLGMIYVLYRFLLAGITFNQSTYELSAVVRFFPFWQQGLLVIGVLFIGLISSSIAASQILRDLRN